MWMSFMVFLLLSGCSSPDTFGDYSYSDYQKLEHWDELEDIGMETYAFVLVYNRDFFGGLSTGTEMISEDVLRFGSENPMGYPMYRIDQSDIRGIRPSSIQRRDPKVLIVRYGEVVDKYYGALPIMNFLDANEQERYQYPELYNQITVPPDYEDHNHFSLWHDIREMARDTKGLVFIYDKNQDGLTEASLEVDSALFNLVNDNDLLFYIGNGQTLIGVVPEEVELTYPALFIVENNVIIESFYKTEDILSFVEQFDIDDFQ